MRPLIRKITGMSPRWLMILVCGMMAFSAYQFRPEADSSAIAVGVAALLMGGVIFWLSKPPPILTTFEISLQPDSPVHRVQALFGCACLFFLTVINASGLERTGVTVHVQFALLAIGTILLASGLTGWRGQPPRIDYREGLIVLTVTIMALAIRLWKLGDAVSIPVSDEYTFAQMALNLQTDNRYSLLHPFDTGYAFSWVYPYLTAASLSLLGSTVESLRLPSVAFGTLTVPALYLLGKYLFNRRIGLLAAIILATFPPHIHLSRMALNNIADPLFGILALAFAIRGLQSTRRADFVLSGIALGLTHYFYEAGRLVFPPLVILYLMPTFQRLYRRSIFLVVGLLALALPIYLTLSASGYSPAPRLNFVAPGPVRFDEIASHTVSRNILSPHYLERVGGVLLFFVHTLDNSPEFYGGLQPMILTVFVPVFLLGLCYAIYHWRIPGNRLLLLWFVGTVLGMGLIRIGAWTARYPPVFPLIALLMALGVYAIARSSSRLAVGLILVIAIGQVGYYFGPHLEIYNRQARPWRDYADAYHRAIEYPSDSQVIFITDDPVHLQFRYLNILKLLWKTDLPVTYYRDSELDYQVLTTLPQNASLVFFVNPDDPVTPLMLRLKFQLEGPYYTPYNVPDDKQYVLYYTSAR
jgi:4-amino-4-deoxy-L-arabinose transferase-like glycosyltransferase